MVTSMLKRIVIYSSGLLFALAILLISIFRTAAVKYDVPQTAYLAEFNSKVLGESTKVDYVLPYPGKVLPGSFLWPIKVVRDRMWLLFTSNPERKAELLLLFSDKRLASSKLLFDQGDYSEGYVVLTKAEKYLEEAYLKTEENRVGGRDTRSFYQTLAKASLKHYEVSLSMIDSSPEEMKSDVIRIQRYPKYIYEGALQGIVGYGESPPINPFQWN